MISSSVIYRDLGITCIDAAYIRPGVACFYLLQDGDQYAVIETGTSHSLPNLIKVMREQRIALEQVRYVIPTHVHLDHAGGAGAMMQLFPEARLLIHPRGARHLIDPARLVESSRVVYGETRFVELYGEIIPVAEDRVFEIEDGETLRLGNRMLEFRHTRGHANHHFCIWDQQSRGWFSGDMFGISYPWFRFVEREFLMPATTPTQFDPEDYLASLDLLASYQPERLFLTHSGELPFRPQHLELLRAQLCFYRDIGEQLGDDYARLLEQLSDYSLGLLQAFDDGATREIRLDEMRHDLDLNAQGIAAWQRRLRKRPAVG